MASTGPRREGLRRLVLGPVMVAYMVVVLVVLLVLAIPAWLINNLWQVVFGRALMAENSRLGYYWYWMQSNFQWAISGRGDAEFLP